MTSTIVAGLALYVLGVSSPGAAEPYSFGRLGEQLSRDDITAIARLATKEGGAPWALYGWYSQTLPETWYVDAFLPPSLSTSRLKRGRVLHLRCIPVSSVCEEWERVDTDTEFAQVAAGPTGLGQQLGVERPLERPIRVTGDFSDDELTTLVEYIRSSPTPPTEPGWHTFSVSGAIPILDILQMPDGSVWVRLSQTGNPGETATVVRSGDGWQIVELVHWVA